MGLRRIATQICLATCIGTAASAAPLSQSAPLTDDQWSQLRQQVVLLDKIAFLPSLLPVVMTHQDALELSSSQLASFRDWRRLHYQDMVNLMNEIIQRRIALRETMLNNAVSQADLLTRQRKILGLQEELMRIRLSCREIIIDSFTESQWENLAFILEEYPQYAGLMD